MTWYDNATLRQLHGFIYLFITWVWGPYRKLWTPSFFFLLWPKCKVCGPWKYGTKKTRIHNLPYGVRTVRDRANESYKMFVIWLCWLFLERNEIIWRFDRRSRATDPYGYFPTWNWPITQHAKSVSHIITKFINAPFVCSGLLMKYLTS